MDYSCVNEAYLRILYLQQNVLVAQAPDAASTFWTQEDAWLHHQVQEPVHLHRSTQQVSDAIQQQHVSSCQLQAQACSAHSGALNLTCVACKGGWGGGGLHN